MVTRASLSIVAFTRPLSVFVRFFFFFFFFFFLFSFRFLSFTPGVDCRIFTRNVFYPEVHHCTGRRRGLACCLQFGSHVNWCGFAERDAVLGIGVSYLVGWCFEPSEPQRITSELNTNFTLSPGYSFHKSSYHKSCFFEPIYIPRAVNTGTCIRQGDLFYSAGLHGNRC